MPKSDYRVGRILNSIVMKKKLLILSICVVGVVGSVFATVKLTTSCGFTTYIPSASYFENNQAFWDFVDEVEDIYCGGKSAMQGDSGGPL